MSELDPYCYELPAELIAQYPLRQRSDARLMVVDRTSQSIDHRYVRDLPELLMPGDCLVLNDTRVIPARLVGYRQRTGGRWQGLFLSWDDHGNWQVMCRTRGKLDAGEIIVLQDSECRDCLSLRLLLRLDHGNWVCRPTIEGTPLEWLEQAGRVPLPPYIRHGEMVPADRESYQTVYADQPGAVAAPTAGLHFTNELLAQIRRRGVTICRLTLHVSAGTFRPITTERIGDHPMHAEWGRINEQSVEQIAACRAAGGRIVAVGTTSVRVLETASATTKLAAWQGTTDLFIRPPYTFRSVDALMTNFHLPRSTLLVLVHCFAGSSLVRRAYEEAIEQRYRFYSYGDAMLIV